MKMKAGHALRKQGVEKEVFDDVGFLLSSKRGGYLSLSSQENFSRYQGAYTFQREPYKVIENIRLLGKMPTELINRFHCVERKSGRSSELFTLHEDAVLYEISHFNGEFQLDLDCRETHNYTDMGRIYTITLEDGVLVVKYQRRGEEKACYLAIKTLCNFKRLEKWTKRSYEYDASRDSMPSHLYVFEALRFRVRGATKMALAYSFRKEEAIEKCKVLYARSEIIKDTKRQYYEKIAEPDNRIKNPLVRMAYSCAKKQLDDLSVEVEGKDGLFAGLPWFFHLWTRDEAISLKALMILGRYKDVKNILARLLQTINEDGRIPNKWPASDLSSADGVGWAFRRLQEYMDLMKSKGLLRSYFEDDELQEITGKLENSIVRLIKNHTISGFAVNNPKETWMDTEWHGDVRDGARIEIQALRLRMYEFMKELLKDTNNKKDYKLYSELEHEFHKRIKSGFWNGEYLIDGVTRELDPTIRPNALLTHYIAPEILTKHEWKTCFRNMLPKLWCEWGGLTTIDRSHQLFVPRYTGQNNQSYHRGDSWFFINNLAALSMAKLDYREFHSYIEAIIKASAEDILFKGFIGHASEVSSAERLEAKGCLSQLWSAATFIELVNGFHGIQNA